MTGHTVLDVGACLFPLKLKWIWMPVDSKSWILNPHMQLYTMQDTSSPLQGMELIDARGYERRSFPSTVYIQFR